MRPLRRTPCRAMPLFWTYLRRLRRGVHPHGRQRHLCQKQPLHGVGYRPCRTAPSLGPVLMVLGLLCKGTTVIRNAERLRLKESDRIAAMEAELRACGGVLESEGGTITVHGCAERLHAPAAPLHGHNDHRVVMSLAVLAAAAGLPLTVDDAEAIQKSWPGFFADAAPLGVEVEDA